MSLATSHASPDDAPRIAALQTESWRRTYRGTYRDDYLDHDVAGDLLALWQQRLSAADPNQLVLLVENGRALIGFTCVYIERDPTWGSLIDNLHVAHQHQRSGAGTTLVREAARWLGEQRGDVGVFLWTLEENAGARRFYERLGARVAEVVELDLRGGGTGASCRYVRDSPAALLAACA